MKIIKWLKQTKIAYNKKNTNIFINGMMIHSSEISKIRFIKKRDTLYCEQLINNNLF